MHIIVYFDQTVFLIIFCYNFYHSLKKNQLKLKPVCFFILDSGQWFNVLNHIETRTYINEMNRALGHLCAHIG